MRDLYERLVQLETWLHTAEVRHDPVLLETLLHPSFREFGCSGRAYDRHAVISALLSEKAFTTIWSQDFMMERLDEHAVLLTYRSAIEKQDGELERHANRSSIWLNTDVGWQMIFHQGTPTDPFPKLQSG